MVVASRNDRVGADDDGRYLAVIASAAHPEKCNFKRILGSSGEILLAKNYLGRNLEKLKKFEGNDWRQLTSHFAL